MKDGKFLSEDRSMKSYPISRRRLSNRRHRCANLIDRIEPRWLLSTFTVNTASDVTNPSDGFTTLREAIVAANAHAGADTINFSPTVLPQRQPAHDQAGFWSADHQRHQRRDDDQRAGLGRCGRGRSAQQPGVPDQQRW